MYINYFILYKILLKNDDDKIKLQIFEIISNDFLNVYYKITL